MSTHNAYGNLVHKGSRTIISLFIILMVVATIALMHARFNFAFEAENILSPEEFADLHSDADNVPREMLAVILSDPNGEGVPHEIIDRTSRELAGLDEIRHAASETTLPAKQHLDFFRMDDGNALIFLEPSQEGTLTIQQSERLVGHLDEVVERILAKSGVGYRLVGTSPTRVALHRAFRRDILAVTIPLLLIILLLPFLLYRSWSYVVLPGLAGIITMAATFALYGSFGSNFTYFSLTLAPLLLCLAVMDAMYFVDRFWRNSCDDGDRAERLKRSIGELAAPCALTSATTAIGFASLSLISSTPMLKEYGAYAAIGVTLAFVFVFTLVPALLAVWPEPSENFRRRTQRWGDRITAIARTAFNHPARVIVAFAVSLVVLAPFASRITVEGSYERFFPPNHPTQQGIDTLSDHLGSLAPMTFRLYSTTPEKSTRLEYLMTAHSFERWVGNRPEVGRTLSPLALMPSLALERKSGETIFSLMKRIEAKLDEQPLEEIARASGGWITVDDRGRLAGIRIAAWPTKLTADQFVSLKSFIDENEKHMLGAFRLSRGGAYLLQQAIEKRFVKEALTGLAVSAILVLLITLIPLGSWRLSLIFIIANAFPLAAVAGIMGFAHIPFSLALVGLPCMLFGIIVDDSIHSLWTYRRTGSIEATYDKKGRAIAITSLLLIVAFGGQGFSWFVINRQFGILAAAGVAIALLADLLLVPALIRAVARRSSQPAP